MLSGKNPSFSICNISFFESAVRNSTVCIVKQTVDFGQFRLFIFGLYEDK